MITNTPVSSILYRRENYVFTKIKTATQKFIDNIDEGISISFLWNFNERNIFMQRKNEIFP